MAGLMKICFLSRDYPPNFVGGVGTYVLEISRALAGLGHEVHVITGAGEGPAGEFLEEGVHVHRFAPHPLSFLSLLREPFPSTCERLEYSFSVFQALKKLVKKHAIDIVESCEARFEGLWYYLWRKNPPLVIKLHTPEGIVYKLNREELSGDQKLIRLLEEFWILKAKKKIGLSRAIWELCTDHYALERKEPPFVPNPVDLAHFKPSNQEAETGLVLYCGRLEFRKGVHILVRSIPYILEKCPQAKFVFLGDDCGMKGYLTRKVTELGIADKVKFIPAVPRKNMPEYYRRGQVCVVPSLWENYPYAVLEAMACGRTVIASRCGGIPEILRDGENGVLTEPGSVIGLADSIIKLLTNEVLRDRLEKNARNFVEKNCNPEEVARKTLEIYEKLNGSGC